MKRGGYMSSHIKHLQVNGFRGLQDLTLTDLNNVNLIVGNNNVGKTSILEAISFFCNQTDGNILTLARQRDKHKGNRRNSLTDVEAVEYLFSFSPNDDEKGIICVGKLEQHGRISVTSTFQKKNFLATELSSDDESSTLEEKEDTELTLVVQSKKADDVPVSQSITVTGNDKKRIYKKEGILPVVTIHVIDHLTGNPFNQLTSNKDDTERAVKLLQNFNSKIRDLRNINDNGNRSIPKIEMEGEAEYVPLSLFGDGLKKALTLLEGLILAKDGILLIDEYETALHTSVMQPVFQFLLDTAQELNVQLFLTTHSLESIDKLLECENFLKDIQVICIHQEDKTYAKGITGTQAKEDRRTYELELRE